MSELDMRRSRVLKVIGLILALAVVGGLVWRVGQLRERGRVIQEVYVKSIHVEIRETPPNSPLFWKIMPKVPGRVAEWLSQFVRTPVSTVRIWNGADLVYEQDGFHFEVVGLKEGPTKRPQDLTGDGIPDLALEEFSGGAHCCFTLHLFRCDGRFAEIATIASEHSEVSFKDLTGDGVPELIAQDWTYQYWPSSFAGSPAPAIVLRWDGSRFRVAPELMRKPPPDEADLAKVADRLRLEMAQEPSDEISPELWSVGLDLLYTGNHEAGWKFMRNTIGTNSAGMKHLGELEDLVKGSPWWRDMIAQRK